MKHRIITLTVVAMCMGLPSLAMSRPNDENRDLHRDGRDEPKRPNDPRAEPKGEVPPGARPLPPEDRANAVRYEQRLKQEQDADRAHRRELMKDEKRWDAERNMRAENRRRSIIQQFARVAELPAARAELAVHADRMARLNRAMDIAESTSDSASLARINDLIRRENARHARTMADFRVGAP